MPRSRHQGGVQMADFARRVWRGRPSLLTTAIFVVLGSGTALWSLNQFVAVSSNSRSATVVLRTSELRIYWGPGSCRRFDHAHMRDLWPSRPREACMCEFICIGLDMWRRDILEWWSHPPFRYVAWGFRVPTGRIGAKAGCVVVPLGWCPVLFLGFLGLCLRRWSARVRTGYCACCGYNLTGNVSGTCPECGLSIRGDRTTNPTSDDAVGAKSRAPASGSERHV